MAHQGSATASLPSQDPLLGETTHSIRRAMQRYPLLIGISGKRIFDEDVQTDRAIAIDLAARFRKLFDALDQEFPETPKVILTGAAFGTDLIAAETAFQVGRNWAVAAILPFDRVLFAEDFDSSLDSVRPALTKLHHPDLHSEGAGGGFWFTSASPLLTLGPGL
jgi:hypothetical protein